MTRYNNTLPWLAAAILICWQLTGLAETSVWKVSKGENYIYLGGTIHMLKPEDFPLPPAFERAYQDSQCLLFETDISAINQPEVQARLLNQAIAPPAQQLNKVLSARTYQLLSEAASSRGVDMAFLSQFKAGMVIVTLQSLDYLRLGMTNEGVDAWFYARASRDGKAIGTFEALQQQLDILLNMGLGWEDDFVRLSLRDLERNTAMMDDIVNAWRTGKTASLQTLFVDEMQKDYPRAYKDLMVNRNNNWLPQILQLFETPGVEFVLVGTAHMVGEHGLLALLEQQGYHLTQM